MPTLGASSATTRYGPTTSLTTAARSSWYFTSFLELSVKRMDTEYGAAVTKATPPGATVTGLISGLITDAGIGDRNGMWGVLHCKAKFALPAPLLASKTKS